MMALAVMGAPSEARGGMHRATFLMPIFEGAAAKAWAMTASRAWWCLEHRFQARNHTSPNRPTQQQADACSSAAWIDSPAPPTLHCNIDRLKQLTKGATHAPAAQHAPGPGPGRAAMVGGGGSTPLQGGRQEDADIEGMRISTTVTDWDPRRDAAPWGYAVSSPPDDGTCMHQAIWLSGRAVHGTRWAQAVPDLPRQLQRGAARAAIHGHTQRRPLAHLHEAGPHRAR
jgi:hypothetical protein